MVHRIISKGEVVIFVKHNGAEYVCVNPMKYNIGSFPEGSHIGDALMAKLNEEIEFTTDPNVNIMDSNKNTYTLVTSNYRVIIKLELVGGRPPITKYP